MSVKIRLTRMGKKKQPSYRVVVVDSRKPRDGAYIEQIGRYDPRAEPSLVEINNERALDWLQKGAQPTERAKKLLEISGAWTRFAVDRGDIHTVGAKSEPESKPEPTPEPVAAAVADEEPVSAAPAVEEAPAEEAVVEAVAEAVDTPEATDASEVAQETKADE
jgi:small subunit ribosomal protein S16